MKVIIFIIIALAIAGALSKEKGKEIKMSDIESLKLKDKE